MTAFKNNQLVTINFVLNLLGKFLLSAGVF